VDFAEFVAALELGTSGLAARDPVMAGLVAVHGPCGLAERRGDRSHFAALCESVVYQQLAGRAAATIYGRFCAAMGGPPAPTSVLALSDTEVRAAGLSAAKARCVAALAAAGTSGPGLFDDVDSVGEEELVTRLTAVPGIGRWTAEMFLIFQLWRLDVWPVGDLGVRKGYARAYGLDEAPTPKELAGLGEPFRPYRSVAAWYCWRAAEQKAWA
jgi:3-methyladenine DNA glycosylase/8-oxoguanine DNA glycosylase